MRRFWLYLPLQMALLFVLVAFYLQSFVESAEPKTSPELYGIVFAVISLLSMAFIYRTMLPRVLQASSEKEVEQAALACISSSELPMVFGFVHYFLFGMMHYFGIFMLFGLFSWLVFYRKITDKLSTVS